MSRLIVAVACAATLTVSALRLFADDKAPATQPAGIPPAMMDPAAMQAAMEAWMKHATPGPEHAGLAREAGNWDFEIEDFTMGGAKHAGTTRITSIMGGRYLLEEVSGQMMGMPFEGLMLLGYDNTLKRYDSVWIDNMGTSISHSHGQMTADGKLELKGEMLMPDTGKMAESRSVTTFHGDDKRTMEMYMPGPDGKEMLAIRITYTRAK